MDFELAYKEIEYEGEPVYYIYVIGGTFGATKDPNYKTEGTGIFSKLKNIDGVFDEDSNIKCVVYKKDGSFEYLKDKTLQ